MPKKTQAPPNPNLPFYNADGRTSHSPTSQQTMNDAVELTSERRSAAAVRRALQSPQERRETSERKRQRKIVKRASDRRWNNRFDGTQRKRRPGAVKQATTSGFSKAIKKNFFKKALEVEQKVADNNRIKASSRPSQYVKPATTTKIERRHRGLQRARSRMGKPKVRGLGFLTFVPDFLDFKNQMEATKNRRKRAQQGFLPGGST